VDVRVYIEKKGRKIQSLGELLGLAIKMGRLIWFGHIERKDNGTPEKFPMELNQGWHEQFCKDAQDKDD